MVPFPLVLKYLLVSPLHRWHGITATRVSLSWYCQGARPVPCQTVDWVTLKYTRLWLHDFFHYQSLIWHNNRYEKVVSGFVRSAWGVLIGKWMRERASVLEVEETANVVFAFSEEAGSGEPNPGLRPKKLGTAAGFSWIVNTTLDYRFIHLQWRLHI